MKYILLFLLFSQITFAQQSRFQEGENIYVWAVSGLNMRKLPDAKSEKIASLPYGTKVTVQPNIGVIVAHEVKEFKDFKVKGVWLLVKYGEKEGFVFDGYMSRLVAPEESFYSGKWDEDLCQYLKKVVGKKDKLLYMNLGKINRKTNEDYPLGICDPCIQKYNQGIVK